MVALTRNAEGGISSRFPIDHNSQKQNGNGEKCTSLTWLDNPIVPARHRNIWSFSLSLSVYKSNLRDLTQLNWQWDKLGSCRVGSVRAVYAGATCSCIKIDFTFGSFQYFEYFNFCKRDGTSSAGANQLSGYAWIDECMWYGGVSKHFIWFSSFYEFILILFGLPLIALRQLPVLASFSKTYIYLFIFDLEFRRWMCSLIKNLTLTINGRKLTLNLRTHTHTHALLHTDTMYERILNATW